MGTLARLFPRQSLGESRRKPPEFLQPARDHAPAIEHQPVSAADDTSLAVTVPEGVQIVVSEPAAAMGCIPARYKDSLEPSRNREPMRHGVTVPRTIHESHAFTRRHSRYGVASRAA